MVEHTIKAINDLIKDKRFGEGIIPEGYEDVQTVVDLRSMVDVPIFLRVCDELCRESDDDNL